MFREYRCVDDKVDASDYPPIYNFEKKEKPNDVLFHNLYLAKLNLHGADHETTD